MGNTEKRKPVFLITHPRTASNLLMQMLRTHPDIQPIEYPFVDTYYFGHESLTRRKNAKMEATRQKFQSDPSLIHTYQEAFNLLKESIDSAQDMGKTPLIKEHAFTIMKPGVVSQNLGCSSSITTTPQVTEQTGRGQNDTVIVPDGDDGNPTLLPSDFLRNVVPVFLIRHPALVFESVLRVCGPTMGATLFDDEFPIDASLRWQRVLYDWFIHNANGVRPIVVNADEIIAHPEIVQKLCTSEQLALDPSGVRFRWDPTPQATIEGQSAYHKHFFSTIQSSCGVQMDKHSAAQGKAQGSGEEREGQLDLDALSLTWREKHGAEATGALRAYVDAAMPDYHYLRCFELHIEE